MGKRLRKEKEDTVHVSVAIEDIRTEKTRCASACGEEKAAALEKSRRRHDWVI